MALAKVARIEKVVGPRRYVFGRAMTATIEGRPVVDADGDIVTPEELEKAAHAFARKRTLKVVHRGRPVGEIVESFVSTADKAEALGLGAGSDVAWWVGVRVDDPEIWALVESGQLREFSIGGDGEREPVTRPPNAHVSRYAGERTHKLYNLDLDELSLVPEGAGERVGVLVRKGRVMLKIPFRLAVLDGAPEAKRKVEKALRADDQTREALEKGALDMGMVEEALRMDPELLRIIAQMIDQAQQAGIKPSEAPAPEAPAEGGLPDPDKMGMPPDPDKMEGEEPDEAKGYGMAEKALKRLQAEKEALAKRLQAVEEQAEIERVERERERFVAKVRAEFGHVPLPEALTAELLRSVDPSRVEKSAAVTITLSKSEAEALREGLARVENVLKASEAFRARGSSRRSGFSGSAADERDRIAAELQKSNPGMTLARARHEAVLKSPDLAERLRKGA